MNTSVKIAALVSVLIFGAIIGAGIFLTSDTDPVPGDPGGGISYTEEGEKPAGTDSGTEAVGFRKVQPGEKIERGSVLLSAEVRDKARDRILRNARIRVFKRSETERIGTEIDIRGQAGFKSGPGSATFSLEPGPYEIMAQCAGYTGETMQVVLVKDQEQQSLVFKLDRGTSISGIVVDRGGKPIAGARVFAFKELASPDEDLEGLLRRMVDLEKLNEEVHSETITGADGKFQLDGLETFWYSIRAVAATFSPGTSSEIRAPRKDLRLVLD